MKAQKSAQTQTVKVAKTVVPQNSAKAQKVLKQQEAVVSKDTTEKEAAKVKKQRAESMENLALRLRKEKATKEAIDSAFIAAYKVKGVTDAKFIEMRIAIYLKIADKNLAKAK